jgi:hypothetical protein
MYCSLCVRLVFLVAQVVDQTVASVTRHIPTFRLHVLAGVNATFRSGEDILSDQSKTVARVNKTIGNDNLFCQDNLLNIHWKMSDVRSPEQTYGGCVYIRQWKSTLLFPKDITNGPTEKYPLSK